MRAFAISFILRTFVVGIEKLKLKSMKQLSRIAFVALTMILMISELYARELNVVPEPAYVDLEAEGDYLVTEKTRIIVVDEMWNPAERFAEDMMAHFGSERPMRLTKSRGCEERSVSFIRSVVIFYEVENINCFRPFSSFEAFPSLFCIFSIHHVCEFVFRINKI